MIPKLKFQVHELFIRVFLFPNTPSEKKLFRRNAEDFQKFFASEGKAILQSIMELSGYKWQRPEIPVYLIPWQSPNLVIPFTKSNLERGLPGVLQTLGMGDRLVRDTHVFIHELVHISQRHTALTDRDNPFTASGNINRREAIADFLCLHTIRHVFGNNSIYETDFWEFLRSDRLRIKTRLEELEKALHIWDVSKQQPLQKFLMDSTAKL